MLLAFILLIGGLIYLFYDDLAKLWTKTFSMDSYELVKDVMTIQQDHQQTFGLGLLTAGRDSLLIPGAGYGITLTWNMYIDSVGPDRIWSTNYARDKPIFRLGNSPQILYNPKYNVLKVLVAYKESPFFSHYPVIELRNVQLDRWNSYAVVIDNNNVKIYFNGKQVVNKKLASVPLIEEADVVLGEKSNNIIGKIQGMRLYFRPYNNAEIKKI